MQLTVKGKHLDVGDSLRAHVESSLSHTAEKYFRNPVDATVIFTKEKGHRYRADISVHLGGGVVLQAQHEADDPYPAFDVAASRVATRLARYKDKVRDHHRWEDPVDMHEAAYTTFQANENEAAAPAPITIAEMQTQVATLAVSDAVMRLELGDLPALLFKNPKHGGFNLVYRRKDGNIGWIDPADGSRPAASPGSAGKAKAKVKVKTKAKAKAKSRTAAKKPAPRKAAPKRKAAAPRKIKGKKKGR
jgi:ribosomal subunit interface protein